MLGVILLGNNLVNAAAATLVSVITIELFGEEKWALSIGTLLVTFAILVFAEITPKVIGAAHADRLARLLAYLIWPLLRAAYPVVWFVNLFVEGAALAVAPEAGSRQRELPPQRRGTALAGAGIRQFHPQQHRDILLNLFELEQLTVADVMTPRGEIEAIDITAPIEDIKQQLATSFHTRVAVFENDPANIIGILHQRRLLADAFAGGIDHELLRDRMSEPYFIPPQRRSTHSCSSSAKIASASAWWSTNTAKSTAW
jgi:Mg2+/Co2+ transporter CorB